LFLLHVLIKKFWAQQNLEGNKNFGSLATNDPRGYRSGSSLLA